MDYQDIYNPHYYGRGRVHFGAPMLPYAADGVDLLPPGRFVGNVRTFTITPDLEPVRTLAWDTRSNLVLRSITARLELYGHGGDNLAMALAGTHVQAVGTAQRDVIRIDRVSLPAESMLFTSAFMDVNWPVEVRPSWTDWSEGTHWERAACGIRLMQGASGPSGGTIEIRYTSVGGALHVEGSSTHACEISIGYVGINRTDQAQVRVDCYRCRPALDGEISVISSEVGILAISLNILPVQTAPGVTRWYRSMRAPYLAGHHAQ